MNLWIDERNKAQHDFLQKWIWVTNVSMGLAMIRKQRETTDPIELVSISPELADAFLERLVDENTPVRVSIHGGEPSDKALALIAKHHFDRKPMDQRTAEIIMVLKGNHNLEVDCECVFGSYLKDLALYMSDDCMCPFNYYTKHPEVLQGVIQVAVLDYLKACDNPSFFMWNFFENRRMFGEIYNETELWCSVLAGVAVRDRGHYINGFSPYNTKDYQRKEKFIP